MIQRRCCVICSPIIHASTIYCSRSWSRIREKSRTLAFFCCIFICRKWIWRVVLLCCHQLTFRKYCGWAMFCSISRIFPIYFTLLMDWRWSCITSFLKLRLKCTVLVCFFPFFIACLSNIAKLCSVVWRWHFFLNKYMLKKLIQRTNLL